MPFACFCTNSQDQLSFLCPARVNGCMKNIRLCHLWGLLRNYEDEVCLRTGSVVLDLNCTTLIIRQNTNPRRFYSLDLYMYCKNILSTWNVIFCRRFSTISAISAHRRVTSIMFHTDQTNSDPLHTLQPQDLQIHIHIYIYITLRIFSRS